MDRVEALTLDEVHRMIRAALDRGRYRDALVLGLGAGLGLRASDIVLLRWGEILAADGSVKSEVRISERKTRSFRILKIPVWLRRLIEQYVTVYGLPDPGERIAPLRRESVWHIVERYGEICGIKKDLGAHSLRKCFCSEIYRRTRDPVVTCVITGHRSPAQLLAYIGELPQTAERIMDEFARVDFAEAQD